MANEAKFKNKTHPTSIQQNLLAVPSQKPTNSNQNIVNVFAAYLKSIKTNSQLSFNLEIFKTSNDNERRQCAFNLLVSAIDHPTKIEEFAQIANRIQFKPKGDGKSFIFHLQDACDQEMKIFNAQHKDWMEVASFGYFLGHMYVLEVQKIYLMNQWCEKIRKLSNDNDLALNMYFKTFKIIHEKMKKKDSRMYKVCLKDMKKYKEEGRVPSVYKNWLNGLIEDKQIRTSLRNSNVSLNTLAQPLTSTTTGTTKITTYFNNTDIRRITVQELYRLIDSYNIENKEKLVNFANSYYNLMLTATEDHKTYATIATIIEPRLPQKSGFINFIIKNITTSFIEETKSFQSKSPENVRKLMLFTKYVASFYSLNKIDPEFMTHALKQLSNNNFEYPIQAYALYELLKIAGNKMVMNGINLTEYYLRLSTAASQDKGIFDYTKMNEVLDFMKEICRFGKQTENRDLNEKEIHEILENLKHDNFVNAVSTIKEMEFSCFDKITEIFVETSIENYENGENFAKFLTEIGKLTCTGLNKTEKSLRCQIMSSFGEKFQVLTKRLLVLNLVKGNKENCSERISVKNKILAILCLISNFYKHKLVKSKELVSFITNLQDLKISKNDLDLDVVKMLIRATKSKINEEILCKFLTEIGFDQPKVIGDEFEFIEDHEGFSKLVILTDEIKMKIFSDEESMKKFSEIIFINCANDENFIPKSIDFCKDLCLNSKFSKSLNEYVKYFGFSIMIKDEEEKFLKNSVTLTTNLYKNVLISYDSLRPWLSSVVISKFTYTELLKIIETIECNKNDDIEVKIHHLQSVVHEKMIEMFNEIKNDLKTFGDSLAQ